MLGMLLLEYLKDYVQGSLQGSLEKGKKIIQVMSWEGKGKGFPLQA